MTDSSNVFEHFFDAEYDGIVRALSLVFGNRAWAEDAAQVAFERAFTRWRRISVMERPGTWVYVVALRHGRAHLVGGDQADVCHAEPFQDDHAQHTVDRLAVGDALRALPARQRAVVVLRYLAGLRLAEIGDAMDISVGTVKSTLHAAHQRLQLEFTDMETGVEGQDAR